MVACDDWDFAVTWRLLMDTYILSLVVIIERASICNGRKYAALDELYFIVANCHPHGFAAAILETIARAMDKY